MSKRGPRVVGNNVKIVVTVHPKVAEYVEQRAEKRYCSPTQYVRDLIVEDMLKHEDEK